MSFLRGLLWFLLCIALITIAMYITGNFALADYLTGLFLSLQPYLPIELNFEQFLVITTVVSLIIAALAVGGAAGIVIYMVTRLSKTTQKQLGQASAAEREMGHVKEQNQHRYEDLIRLSRTLTRRLDKRIIVQGVVDAASRGTSVTQANSAVSLWLLQFDRDVMSFEIGRYCDETFFTQTEYQLTDEPFARVILSQTPYMLTRLEDRLTCFRPEKLVRMGEATSVMVIPLVVESSVLGVCIVLCHPDVLKSYEEQRFFYDAMWGELALALAVAVQGELAILDRLTGMHNHDYFMKRLIQEIDRANRYQFPLSLLMVDIDDFKAVNDMLGHPQGDAVLKIIAKILRKEIRVIDLAGRYGGEEFIIFLPETGLGQKGQGAAGALIVAERIRKAVEEEFNMMQKPLRLGVSIGLVVRRFPEDRDMDQREMIRLVDEQLYRAKTEGKNRVCAHSPEAGQ